MDTPYTLMKGHMGEQFVENANLEHLGQKLKELDSLDGNRILAVSMSRQSGKTLFFAQYYPAWLLREHPDAKILYITHTDVSATAQSKRLERLLNELEIPTEPYSRDRLAKWKVAVGEGTFGAAGIGAALTGREADYIIVDDTFRTAEEVNSKYYQKACWEYFFHTLLCRLNKNGKLIHVCSRLSEKDLYGQIDANRDMLLEGCSIKGIEFIVIP